MKSNNKAFTLIELLAVIVILAIIALIATPIVLNIIANTKENAQLRSAEMYIKGLETSIATSTLNNKKVPDKEYSILPDGNICLVEPTNNTCSDDDTLKVEMNGEKPESGTVTVLNGKVTDIELTYKNKKTIIKNEDEKLVYSDSSSSDLDMSTVSATLEDNDWETIQKVVKAGKVAEAGWFVGNTKKLTINGAEQTATIIGLDHDGENTATFMVMSNIGSHVINSEATNADGWEASEMRDWLNNDIYNGMSNKAQIKEVTKLTNNVGQGGTVTTGTQDKIFLLSVSETNISTETIKEGNTYEYFINNSVNNYFWLRTPRSSISFAGYNYGLMIELEANSEFPVFVAFVIG